MKGVQELLESNDWGDVDVSKGTTFIAKAGKTVGVIRLIEVAPQTVVIDQVLVREDKRGEGIGGRLMQTAMNSRGGSLYLACHDDAIEFYKRFGFSLVSPDTLPEPVSEYMAEVGDLTPPEGHVHFFMTAR
jgi:N-acetylglutamate synthase-like GNAT family acetyltransferase